MKKLLAVITALALFALPLGAMAAEETLDYTWNAYFEVENINETTNVFDLVCYYQSTAPYTRNVQVTYTVPYDVADAYLADWEMTSTEMKEAGYDSYVSGANYITLNRNGFPEKEEITVTLANGKTMTTEVNIYDAPAATQLIKPWDSDTARLFITATYSIGSTSSYYEHGYPLGTEPVEMFRISMKGDYNNVIGSIRLLQDGNTSSQGGDGEKTGYIRIGFDTTPVVTTDPTVYIGEQNELIFVGASSKTAQNGKMMIKIPGYSAIELPAGAFAENPNVFGISVKGIEESGLSFKAISEGISGKTVTVE